jgi:DNA-binding transcriptional regulator YiaG
MNYLGADVTTIRTSPAREIGELVSGHVELQVAVRSGLSPDCALQRNRVRPLIDRAFGNPEGFGSGGLGATEVSNDVGLSHRPIQYSMLNSRIKDAVLVVPYARLHMETMGERIRQLRKARNLTQEEFAKIVGVTKSAVSQWEDGSTKNLKLETFLRVVEALHTDPEFLIFGPERGGATKRSWKSKAG